MFDQQFPQVGCNQGENNDALAFGRLFDDVTDLVFCAGKGEPGDVDLATMVAMTEPYLAFHAGVYGNFYQFADTEKVVRWAIEGLAEVETLEGYAELIGELAIYLNRMDYWVDLKIPWAKFGQVFEHETA